MDKIGVLLAAMRKHVRAEQDASLPYPFLILTGKVLFRSYYDVESLYQGAEAYIKTTLSLGHRLPKLSDAQILAILQGELSAETLIVRPDGESLSFCDLDFRWGDKSHADEDFKQVVVSKDLVVQLSKEFECSFDRAFEVIAAHEAGHLINHQEDPLMGIDEWAAWATASKLIKCDKLFKRMCKHALKTYSICPVKREYYGIRHLHVAHPCEWSIKRGIIKDLS